MRKIRWFSVVVPSALFVLTLVFGIFQWRQARSLALDVSAMREKAYFSAADGLETLEADLSKVQAVSSPGQQAMLLTRVASVASGVAENLAALPTVYGADEAGLKFLRQTADYAQTLAVASAEGGALTDNDRAQLAQLWQKSGELRAHLAGGADFAYDLQLESAEGTGIDYPSLLYDGPFSDGIRLGEARGLSGGEVTAEEAMAIARAFVGEERVQGVERTADLGGPLPSWGVALDLGDVSVTMQITRQGGKALWMSPESAGFETALSLEECALHARAFLFSRGFGQMQESYYQQYDGMAVVSFAAVQDDVVLYPDLVKVQVRMDTGAVVGLEANSYWMNHVTRERLHPVLEEAEARALVSDRLDISASRLCVIPVDDGLGAGRTELLCWEFDGVWNDNRYLVYIDAETGEEAEVLKVIEGNGWILAL